MGSRQLAQLSFLVPTGEICLRSQNSESEKTCSRLGSSKDSPWSGEVWLLTLPAQIVFWWQFFTAVLCHQKNIVSCTAIPVISAILVCNDVICSFMFMGGKTVMEYSLNCSCLVQAYNIAAKNVAGASHLAAFPPSCHNVLCLLVSLQVSLCPLRTSHFCDDVHKSFNCILKLASSVSISVLIKLKN